MTVTALRVSDPIPDTAPARYVNADGYVRLRWRVGPDTYVEEYEHRVVMGRPRGQHVHHRNGDKADNRPANVLRGLRLRGVRLRWWHSFA